MLRSKRLNDEGVANLKTPSKRLTIPDPELRGHYIRVTPNGAKSYWAVARDPSGKQHWKLIGEAHTTKIDDARDKATKLIRAIRASVGGDVAKDSSFKGVSDDWFRRHVEEKGLRSAKEVRKLLSNYIQPPFAGMEFVDVRRKHIVALLDSIQDKHGVRQSDYCLSIISGCCTWYAKRDEDYASPIIRGMKRQTKNDRDRVLTDSEIRTLWGAGGLFGNFTKLALLTGQRKGKLLTMRYEDVRNGVWYIQTQEREKGNGEELRLPTMALEILAQQKTICPGPGVFPRHESAINRLQADFACEHGMVPWVIHDLRRTARTLMAAVGVPDRTAELVLGHVQQGVAAVYNRHTYAEEKGDALDKLAARLNDIIMCKRIAA
jgi:integrase